MMPRIVDATDAAPGGAAVPRVTKPALGVATDERVLPFARGSGAGFAPRRIKRAATAPRPSEPEVGSFTLPPSLELRTPPPPAPEPPRAAPATRDAARAAPEPRALHRDRRARLRPRLRPGPRALDAVARRADPGDSPQVGLSPSLDLLITGPPAPGVALPVSPSPSWPDELPPQQSVAPSAVTAHEWSAPRGHARDAAEPDVGSVTAPESGRPPHGRSGVAPRERGVARGTADEVSTRRARRLSVNGAPR
jgi:hypothetical protein